MALLKHVTNIKEFGVFEDFRGAHLPDFAAFNLIFGWNYSGKTTLSRVLQCIEYEEMNEGYEHPIVQSLTNRKQRDRHFRRSVLAAYSDTCAVTGWKLINGGGRAEAEAAHIKSVEHNGPDSVQNGVALSGTVHWMFDRGLIGLSDELEILIHRKVNDRSGVEAIINPTGRLIAPARGSQRPHPAFLDWHRGHHGF